MFVACYFLLLPTPLGELDFVREQVTTCHDVPKTELSAQCTKALRGLLVAFVTLVDFYDPIVVRIPSIPRNTISGHFLLEVDVGNRRANVMGMKRLVGLHMTNLDALSGGDECDVVVDPASVRVAIGCSVYDAPFVVVVSMRIERDLLF